VVHDLDIFNDSDAAPVALVTRSNESEQDDQLLDQKPILLNDIQTAAVLRESSFREATIGHLEESGVRHHLPTAVAYYNGKKSLHRRLNHL
jgi:hypothetical protein